MKIVTGWNLGGKGTQNNLTTVCSSSVHARRFWGHLLTRSRSADFSFHSALVWRPVQENILTVSKIEQSKGIVKGGNILLLPLIVAITFALNKTHLGICFDQKSTYESSFLLLLASLRTQEKSPLQLLHS
jgi:hypothetical protein